MCRIRIEFKKLVKNELHRAQNKVQKLEDDIAAADNAEDYRIKADNLMTYQYQFKIDRMQKSKFPISMMKLVVKLPLSWISDCPLWKISSLLQKYEQIKARQGAVGTAAATLSRGNRLSTSIEASWNPPPSWRKSMK